MAVSAVLSDRAILTAAEAENYIHGEDAATNLSDKQKDNIRLLINGVSATFERITGLPLVKREFTEITNTKGKTIYWLKNYPVDVDAETGDPVLVIYTRPDHTSDWGEEDADDYYVDADNGRIDFTGTYIYTGPGTLKVVYTAGIAEQTRDEETDELDSVDIADDWRSMALATVNYLHQKDLASFSRVQEGVMIVADALPKLVRDFLELNSKVKT